MLPDVACKELLCKWKVYCEFDASWRDVIEAEEPGLRGSSAGELACGSGSDDSRLEGTS